jgi:hypothetical protein
VNATYTVKSASTTCQNDTCQNEVAARVEPKNECGGSHRLSITLAEGCSDAHGTDARTLLTGAAALYNNTQGRGLLVPVQGPAFARQCDADVKGEVGTPRGHAVAPIMLWVTVG